MKELYFYMLVVLNLFYISLSIWPNTYSLTYLRILTYLLHGAVPFLRSQPIFSYSRNSPHFVEPKGSLPHSQVPANCPCPELARSSPHPHNPFHEDPS